ncbi:hypothetical protein Scep_007104 [Stephania cephalantha]|uniref:RNase H type-1 domain-containing protein n=1 Tax=Stephania cephalantha TaxID=152367 RepID=A0AAP0K9F1_9MAGN
MTWTWLAMGLWHIWKLRIKVVFQGTYISDEDTIKLTSDRFIEWCRSLATFPVYSLALDPKVANHFFQGNIMCIAAVRNAISGKMGLRWFVRSQQGLVVLAGSHFIDYSPDVDWAELIAIRHALSTVTEDMKSLTIFSDSQHAIELIKGTSMVSDHNLIADEIRERSQQVGNPIFYHIPRSYNVVTMEDRPPWPTKRVRKKMAGVSHAINFDALGMDAKV